LCGGRRIRDVAKRNGRPLDPDDPSVSVHVRVPSREYDAIATQALREGLSVAEVLRRQLKAAKDDGGK
jgi:hypothetical protein